jgi:hypothetical protein
MRCDGGGPIASDRWVVYTIERPHGTDWWFFWLDGVGWVSDFGRATRYTAQQAQDTATRVSEEDAVEARVIREDQVS